MTMEFYFDDKKCEETGYLKEDCLDAIRRHFAKNNPNGTIKETSEGIFEGVLKDINTFGFLVALEEKEWFRETVSGWYWTVPEMESGKNRVDMIASAKEHGLWE